MSVVGNGEFEALTARLDDLAEKAERGDVGVSQFLTPREQSLAERYLRKKGIHYNLFGGYDTAERRRLYLLPDYMEGFEGEHTGFFEDRLSEYGFESYITALRIKGSGYERLKHRDVLGALLGLGIERSVLGDILILDEDSSEFVAVCDSAISAYIGNELTFVARDKVKVEPINISEVDIPQRKTQAVNDTVAAPRLDAVVAALCDLSREKARLTVTSGLVEIDFESEERPDSTVSEGAVISVRGYGRFRVISLSDKTRKGRYRLSAEKYV